MNYDNYLAHFNPYHDPRNGQFTDGPKGRLNGSKTTVGNAGKRGLTDGQKKAIIAGAVAVGSLLAIYGVTKMPAVKRFVDNTATYSMNAGRLSFRPVKASGGKASSKTKGVLEEHLASGYKKYRMMKQAGVGERDIKLRKLWSSRKMDDNGIRLPPGSILQRIVDNPSAAETIRSADSAFVAATAADKKNYGGFFAALKQFRSDAEMMYTMDMKTVSEIVSPSKKQRVQMFIDMYKENPRAMAEKLATFNKKIYGDQYKETVEELTEKYSKWNMRQLKNKGYYIFANSWFDQETGTFAELKKRLAEQGFNAVIDDNDKRSFVQSQAPLIVFDIPHSIGDISISELPKEQILQNMIDWQNMRHQDAYPSEFMWNDMPIW